MIMNKEEFIKLSVQCGYSNKAAAEAYVKENEKANNNITLHGSSTIHPDVCGCCRV